MIEALKSNIRVLKVNKDKNLLKKTKFMYVFVLDGNN